MEENYCKNESKIFCKKNQRKETRISTEIIVFRDREIDNGDRSDCEDAKILLWEYKDSTEKKEIYNMPIAEPGIEDHSYEVIQKAIKCLKRCKAQECRLITAE